LSWRGNYDNPPLERPQAVFVSRYLRFFNFGPLFIYVFAGGCVIERSDELDENRSAGRESFPAPSERIYDLVDVISAPAAVTKPAEKRPLKQEVIYDLVDVIDKRPKVAFVDTGLHDEIIRRATEMAEKIAREVIPDIAERVIREEIEKLKKGS